MGKVFAILLLVLLPVSGAYAAGKPAAKGPAVKKVAAKAVGNPKNAAQGFLKAAVAKNQASMNKYLMKVHQGKPFAQTLKSFNINGEATVKGREATIPVTMTFSNGKSGRVQVPLTQHPDGWKIRLVALNKKVSQVK